MIYYHFGSKEGLYAAVLEYAYRSVREGEDLAPLKTLPPMEALERYISYAFHSFSRHPDFIRLSQQETLQGARFLRDLPSIQEMNRASLTMLEDIVRRGQADGSISNKRRDLATAVLTALLMQRKLWGVRVHNVVATSDAIAVVRALHSSE